ncbi:hypothetical protein CAPTEDRAFT_162737 [Capitella teleta]|uniref:Uncharacterized protein n=1 Tax=Capitella teleta TaxID=283909 RepID=R7UJ15_CAPTE|nr:hypothetical protein CAPTEDRAFT_162737 [Capitella teleta]|eukprot:ELU03282.1 hypothetical protein CAPTEDRAFT_162737 [Capitella teleta]
MDPFFASSISVSKSCAPLHECTLDHVGCRLVNDAVRCVSCCDHDYCNEAAPLNGQHALDLSSRLLGNVASVASSPSWISVVLLFVFCFWISLNKLCS